MILFFGMFYFILFKWQGYDKFNTGIQETDLQNLNEFIKYLDVEELQNWVDTIRSE